MRKKTVGETFSIIVFLCILTFIVQASVFYFFESEVIFLSASAAINLICCHIFLEKTMNYETCFIYSLFMVFLSSIVSVLLYLNRGTSFIPFSYSIYGIIILNWLIPCLYCFIRCMFDYGPRHEGYPKFFRNTSIVFLLFYFAALVFCFFFHTSLQKTTYSRELIAYIPFMGIASYIEDYIYGVVSLHQILTYLLLRICFFIPFGYYAKLLLRGHGKMLRLLVLILFPVLIEALQYFIFYDYVSIDDVIYGFVGGIIGLVLFNIQNLIFRCIHGQDFLTKERHNSFYRNTLYY